MKGIRIVLNVTVFFLLQKSHVARREHNIFKQLTEQNQKASNFANIYEYFMQN